jgi:hypothetical protein
MSVKPNSLSPFRALALGTLAVGTLDILDAFIFFGLRGAKPMRILQAIAAGVLGRASRDGGWNSAALGLVLHFCVAFGIVATFYLISRKMRWLMEHPFVYGPVYGIIAYLVMNFVVIPLSAANRGAFTTPIVVNGVLIHIFGVGIPSALFARAARPWNASHN